MYAILIHKNEEVKSQQFAKFDLSKVNVIWYLKI